MNSEDHVACIENGTAFIQKIVCAQHFVIHIQHYMHVSSIFCFLEIVLLWNRFEAIAVAGKIRYSRQLTLKADILHYYKIWMTELS